MGDRMQRPAECAAGMGNPPYVVDTHSKNVARRTKRRCRGAKRRQGAALFKPSKRHCASKRTPCTPTSGDEAEPRRGHGAGLAGHGVGEALALESGRQVHFAAGKEAGKKLHDHLHSVAQTGRLRLMEWGSSFAGVDIGLRERKLNYKSEALDLKSDTECDKFERILEIYDYLQGINGKMNRYATCSYARSDGDMASKFI
jgi:hypothetical protein